MSQYLGDISAYAYAQATGQLPDGMTEEEYAELMASYATVGQTAVDAKDAAVAANTSAQTAATTATDKASEATTAAQTATTKAGEASTSASTATSAKDTAVSASQTATSKATEATTAAETATGAATTATTAKDDAVSAKTAAETAQGAAEDAAESVSASAAQIATNTSDISELKSGLTSAVVKVLGKNLFDGITEGGYLKSDGSIQPHSNWVTTDFINVEGLSVVTASGKNTSNARTTIQMFYLCTYNSNQQLIEQVGRVDYNYTVGTGVSYIRFSYHPNDFSEIQVENGSTLTPYEPYSVIYKFTSSPYLEDYTVDYFNKYKSDNNIIGSYINSSGEVKSSGSAIRCKIPVTMGETIYICRPANPSYAVGTGLMIVCDANDTILSAVDMSQYQTLYYGIYPAVQYTVISENASYISFNIKLSTWDGTVDTVVAKRNINTGYNGNYISEIDGHKIISVDSNKWSGKKWVVFGDSLTAINARTTKHYFDYVSAETGITVINMGDSGSGYKSEDDVGTAFYQRITNVPTDADVITIFGSLNDLGTGVDFGTATDTGTDTIGGCVNTTLDNLFDTYPLAVVGIVSPTPWVNANPTNEPNRGSQYCDLLKQICANRSIPYLDLFHSSLLRPWDADFRTLAYSKDEGNGVHPDETGHKLIAPRFKAFLESLII